MSLPSAAMHDLDPVFRGWCRSERVAALLRALGFRRPLPVQSMYILKARILGCCVRLNDTDTCWGPLHHA